MASQDRFDIDMVCPTCDNQGKAQVSENDYPFMKPHSGFSIDKVPTGFNIVQRLNFRDAKVRCKCGTTFQPQLMVFSKD